jgi:hypothetical protein
MNNPMTEEDLRSAIYLLKKLTTQPLRVEHKAVLCSLLATNEHDLLIKRMVAFKSYLEKIEANDEEMMDELYNTEISFTVNGQTLSVPFSASPFNCVYYFVKEYLENEV